MHSKSDQPAIRPKCRRRPAGAGRFGAVLLSVTAASFIWAGPAMATPTAGDPSSGGSTIAEVDVGAAILLSNLTTTFTLAGVPGETPDNIGAVTMNVLSNNASGYNVTVQAEAADLVGTGANADVIPVGDLSVRETTTGTYQQVLSTAPVTVFNKTTRSVGDPGDPLSNDYEFNTGIPDVHNDAYTVTLDYLASTNP